MEFNYKDLDFDIFNIPNKEYLATYIAKNCLKYADPYFFGKLPGTRYKMQYYMANALYNTEFLKKVSEEFYTLINDNIGHFNFQITGREWSSIPLLTSIPILLEKEYNIRINSFLIRKQRKTYGAHNFIEGTPNELPTLIVDDLCNSTDSFIFCYNVLKYENIQCLPFIFAVLNKYKKNVSENYDKEDKYLKNNIKPLTILTGDDIDNVLNNRSEK